MWVTQADVKAAYPHVWLPSRSVLPVQSLCVLYVLSRICSTKACFLTRSSFLDVVVWSSGNVTKCFFSANALIGFLWEFGWAPGGLLALWIQPVTHIQPASYSVCEADLIAPCFLGAAILHVWNWLRLISVLRRVEGLQDTHRARHLQAMVLQICTLCKLFFFFLITDHAVLWWLPRLPGKIGWFWQILTTYIAP